MATKYDNLYHCVNLMMGELGAKGEITTHDTRALDVMDALYELDKGIPDMSIGNQGVREQLNGIEAMLKQLTKPNTEHAG